MSCSVRGCVFRKIKGPPAARPDILADHPAARDAATLLPADTITAEALRKIKDNRSWRHGYLADRGLDEILQGQVYIQTQGSAVGQINGLSVLQHPAPGRPGEPSRITLWAHIGDGEFVGCRAQI